ncbi:MAG: hypothetical protein J2P55_02110 [Rhizobiales bacterium]|nr:hypothetical protein [Hyphomicrobiales bacterium]
MPTSPKAKSEAREFFYDDDGKRADADLHNPILAEGDDAAAKQVSDKVKARLLAEAAAKKKANAVKRWPAVKAWARRWLRR